MSGYLLSAKKYPMDRVTEVLVFLKKRFYRIFPLYWLAFVVFFAMFYLYLAKPLGVANAILHVFGLQLFYGEPIPTIWFIGLITIYYILFALVEYFSRKQDIVFSLCTVCFVLLFVVKSVDPPMDNRIVLYWPIFVFGIWYSRIRPEVSFFRFVIALLVTVFASYGYLRYYEAPESLPVSIHLVLVVGILIVLMGSFVITLFYLCGKCNLRSFANWVYLGAYSSFAIYLFHVPAFQITKTVLGRHETLGIRSLAFVVTLGILFPASYGIQRLNDRIIGVLVSSNSEKGEMKHQGSVLPLQSRRERP